MCFSQSSLVIALMCLQIWSEGGSVHSAGLLLQWLVTCAHSGSSPRWTNGATLRSPAWRTHWPTDHLSAHLVPSISAKWENPSLWVAPQAGARRWRPLQWCTSACLQEHLNYLQRRSPPAIYCIPISGITICDFFLFLGDQGYNKYHPLKTKVMVTVFDQPDR